jgi:TRAP-type C4-dicarboxylate transport system permease small subunit
MNESEASARAEPPEPPAPPRLLEAIAKLLALIGGTVAIAVAAIVVASVLSRWLFADPIPGDFELAQIGTAIAVFAFLPYCQIVRGNIVVDTFTAHLPARVRGRIDALWDIVFAVAMAFVAVCLTRGTLDTFASQEVSMVLRIPVWPGVAFSSFCCAFLAIVSLATASGLLRTRP